MREARGQDQTFSQDFADITTNFLGNSAALTKFSSWSEPQLIASKTKLLRTAKER